MSRYYYNPNSFRWMGPYVTVPSASDNVTMHGYNLERAYEDSVREFKRMMESERRKRNARIDTAIRKTGGRLADMLETAKGKTK